MKKFIKKQFIIEGMHCSSCAMNIDFDLEDIPGIVSVKTSYVKQETEVEFDEERVSLDHILATIKKIGYNAQVKK